MYIPVYRHMNVCSVKRNSIRFIQVFLCPYRVSTPQHAYKIQTRVIHHPPVIHFHSIGLFLGELDRRERVRMSSRVFVGESSEGLIRAYRGWDQGVDPSWFLCLGGRSAERVRGRGPI